MKYPNKKNCRGISIIEIVVSMVLIMLVMLVLAFVYPQGRKVTQGSDNRTKATEIAKSILEEIKLVGFLQGTSGSNDKQVGNLSLLNDGSNDYTPLNKALTHAADMHWPYHHLDTNWDATNNKDVDDYIPVCPFFITDSIKADNIKNHSKRPFFLLSKKVDDDHPQSILVTPTAEVTQSKINSLDHPVMAVINVTVYWGELGRSNNNFVVNHVTLTDSRTQNVY